MCNILFGKTRLFGRVDTTGLLHARVDQQISRNIVAHLTAQVEISIFLLYQLS